MASESTHYGRRFFLHIMNREIQDHIQIEFSVQRHRETMPSVHTEDNAKIGHPIERFMPVAACKKTTRLKGDIDATKISDGDVSRILCLQTKSKHHSLRLHAPWSPEAPLSLSLEPLKIFNPFDLASSPTSSPRSVGIQRTLLDPKPMIELLHPAEDGTLTMRDVDHQLHRVQIQLAPRNEFIAKILEFCLFILPGWTGDWMLAVWWSRYQACQGTEQREWSALVETIFTVALVLDDGGSGRRKKSELSSISSTSVSARASRGPGRDAFSLMLKLEAAWHGSNTLSSPAWAWTLPNPEKMHTVARPSTNRHIISAREFVKSKPGQECIALLQSNPALTRLALTRLLVGLHLLREERKLDITTQDSTETVTRNLAPVLGQLGRWMGWEEWDWKHGHYFAVETPTNISYGFEDGMEPPLLLSHTVSNANQHPFLASN
jgi:anaphase-promoting complex subunit 1